MRIAGCACLSCTSRRILKLRKKLETKVLIHKAKSDNTDLFRNFADSIGAIPLTCDVQNHQEGKWRPVRRGTGCGADGDERQSLGNFTCKLVRYARPASEAHEQQLIELGHPNAFVRNPTPSKRESHSELTPQNIALLVSNGRRHDCGRQRFLHRPPEGHLLYGSEE